jgi:hypothetical protein
VNDELGRMWKEVDTAYFNALPSTFLEWPEQYHETHRQVSRSPGRESMLGTPKYEAGVTELRRSDASLVKFFCLRI